jgi:hypothetical protein
MSTVPANNVDTGQGIEGIVNSPRRPETETFAFIYSGSRLILSLREQEKLIAFSKL